jgi:hypothetical protein
MPTVEEYVEGFNLRNGMVFGNYTLKSNYIQHISIVRWNEYSYPAVLKLSYNSQEMPSNDDIYTAQLALATYLGSPKIIRTAANRPYLCYFQYPTNEPFQAAYSDDYREMTLTFKGYAKRVKEAIASQYM